jgi:hypothetical protein
MLRNAILSLFIPALIILCAQVARAQAVKDSINNRALFTNVEDKFYTEIGPQSRLFSGYDYQGYRTSINGNAYFLDTASWHTGSLTYDGFLYKDVTLIYDIYADELITRAYHSALKLRLLKNYITSFDLLGHHFINITDNPGIPSTPKSGFYDELYGGKTEVLARREKSIQITSNSTVSYFSYSVSYYVYKGGAYYPVSSRGSFLKVFKDRNNELRKFIKANSLRFDKLNKEESFVKVASYYDQITN